MGVSNVCVRCVLCVRVVTYFFYLCGYEFYVQIFAQTYELTNNAV